MAEKHEKVEATKLTEAVIRRGNVNVMPDSPRPNVVPVGQDGTTPENSTDSDGTSGTEQSEQPADNT